MKSKTNRNLQLDVARGIAITLVVLGHSFYSWEEPLNKLILSFHMPLFLFLSGMMAKEYQAINDSIIKYVGKKARTILIPQITLGILVYLYDVLFQVFIKGNSYREVDFIYSFTRWWFLPVLFVVTVLFLAISRLINLKKGKNFIIVILVCLVTNQIMTTFHIPKASLDYYRSVPMALLWYSFGYYFYQHKEVYNVYYANVNQYLAGLMSILCISISIIISQINEPVTMFDNSYGNIFLFFAGCSCGIISIWNLSIHVKGNMFLQWLGRNSIIVYVWQFKLTGFWNNIVEDVMNVLSPNCQNIATVNALLGMCICLLCVIPIIIITNRICPEIYGKKRLKVERL